MERIELSAETLQLDDLSAPQKQEGTIFKMEMPHLSAESEVLYQVKRNPEGRKIFYVDVGNYGKKEAEDYLIGVKDKIRKPAEVDAGYFYCPYLPSLAPTESIQQELSSILSAKIAQDIDEQIQNEVLSLADTKAADWSKVIDDCWDSIAMTAKLEMLGIDKSFLEADIGTECIRFEDECTELAEDLDEFEMMVEFNKIADPNWSDDNMAFARNLFKQGWKAKVRVDESCESSYNPNSMNEDYFFSSYNPSTVTADPGPFTVTFQYDNSFITKEELNNCIITSEL
jgi:hypothetical protein